MRTDPQSSRHLDIHDMGHVHEEPDHAYDGHGNTDEHDHWHDHDHDHDHDHGRGGLLGRVTHALSELFGAHSHEAAPDLDDTMAHTAGRRALLSSLAILGLTAVIQCIVAALSGSVALLGDAFHNVADALTAIPLLIAFHLGRHAANDRYTYGYGRAEDLAGLFVVAMIALSSALAGYEAITRLLHPEPVRHLWAVAAASLVGFLGNEIVARYRITVGRRIGSAALVADGLHARTDGFTSLAVLLGTAGVAIGWNWADPAVGLLITIAILGVLRSAVGEVGGRLMDAVDPELVARARTIVADSPGVQQVGPLRMRWIGHNLVGEVDVAVDSALPVGAAHEIAREVECDLVAGVPRLSSAAVHVCPLPVAEIATERDATR